jgi:hypothetical protein
MPFYGPPKAAILPWCWQACSWGAVNTEWLSIFRFGKITDQKIKIKIRTS